jgi:hypothetical protein
MIWSGKRSAAIRGGSPRLKPRQEPIVTTKTVDAFSPISWLEEYVKAGALRLPSEATPKVSLDDLAVKIRGFVHRYFDCTPLFESLAVLYVLHTWVYERFHAVPYLRFMGLPGSGKTRGTETIGALCYRPLVMAGSSTPAPMFRLIEAIGGTMLIDEADFRFSQIGSDIIKVLNCGYQQGLPVTRMEKNAQGEFVPRIYEVFGPKIINGRRPFQDDATESRCLGYSPHASDRTDIPTQLPSSFERDANEIRNLALGWRMENLDSFRTDPDHVPTLRGRSRQLAIPLLAIAAVMNSAESTRYRDDLIQFCSQREKQAEADRRETVEGKLVWSFISWSGRTSPTCKDLIDDIIENDSGDDPNLQRWLTPKRASAILRSMGFETHHTKRGSEVSIEPGRLAGLCQRFGLNAHDSVNDPGEAA